jgi:predicted transcriptional regulator
MVVKKPDGTLEMEVLHILWSDTRPLSPGDVRTHVSGDLAYTSVATVLTRLVDKGLVHRHRHGRSFLYSPAMSRDEWLSEKLSAVLDESRDRSNLLAAFVGQLSKRDVRELRKLLDAGGSS